jgi:hypothetical protein
VQRVTSIQNPSGPSNFLYTKVGNLIPLWALIPIVAGGAGAGFFFFRRYRNSQYYYEEDEE